MKYLMFYEHLYVTTDYEFNFGTQSARLDP